MNAAACRGCGHTRPVNDAGYCLACTDAIVRQASPEQLTADGGATPRDVAPDREVYVTSSTSGEGRSLYHFTGDPDECPYLANARSIMAKPRGVLFDDLAPCPACDPRGGEPDG